MQESTCGGFRVAMGTPVGSVAGATAMKAGPGILLSRLYRLRPALRGAWDLARVMNPGPLLVPQSRHMPRPT